MRRRASDPATPGPRAWLARCLVLGAAFAAACDGAHPAPDAGLDASAPRDATLRPLAECGNARVEPGESCDDGNLVAGDGCGPSCRWEPFCGDGVRDEGEVCDDGNGAAGDGCAPDCRSDERCGDGVTDVAAGEACDGAPGCTGDCTWEACGDGITAGGEACDDGDRAPFDGCGPDCRPERAFSVHTFEIAPPERGCDFTGDGVPDNRLAQWLRAARVPLGSFFTETLLVDAFVLVALHGLDDPAARDDPHVLVSLLEGWDANDRADDDAEEGTPLAALARSLPRPNRPVHALVGAIEAGAIEAGPGSLRLGLRSGPPQLRPCDLSVRAVSFVLERARLSGRIFGVAGEPVLLEDARLCAAIPLRALATEENAFARFLVFSPCDGVSEPTLADLALGGADLAGIRLAPVSPDVDLDLDGLERYELETSGRPGCQPVVRACIDGDGTRYEGHDCVLRPEMADGLSAAFDLAATVATLAAIFTDEEACARALGP